MSAHKKFQPIQSSRLGGYRQHKYECLGLLYRCILCSQMSTTNERLDCAGCAEKNVSKFGPAVWPAIAHIHTYK